MHLCKRIQHLSTVKPNLLLCLLLAGALSAACAHQPRIVWTEGAADPKTGKAIHEMEIQNPPAGTDWTLWFSQFRTPVSMGEEALADIVHLGGTLYRVIPKTEARDNKLTLRYEARALVNHCRAPEGFYLQKKGEKPIPVAVKYKWQPSERVQSFTTRHVETTVYDMVPRLKSLSLQDGTTVLPAENPEARIVEGRPSGWYRITLADAVTVEAADEDGAFYAAVTLDNLRRNAGGKPVPSAIVEDWPDLPYRGLMLDVSRNFTKKPDLLRLIDILAHYKVNYLHLHLGDDEGWRLEIDGLPELTSYGAFRGIPDLQPDGSITEPDALQPTYCGSRDRNDAASPGNGFYSRADFVEILRYAHARHIRVIPEFDSPGHSRAAIKSMEVRARRTGDTGCLLSEPGDISRYESVQDYTDNAINVALPSTYRFFDKVFESVADLYAEASVPLEAIHIGGDEVPEGAWTGSPACRALMDSTGRSIDELTDYFVSHMLDIAEARGVKIAGWQEVALHLRPETFERLKKNLAYVNLWAVSRGRDEYAYKYANEGINVVLSNASNNYFDMAYNDDKEERGHSWAGYIDERRAFSFLPYDCYRSVRWDDQRQIADIAGASAGKTALLPEGVPHIIGVQGQLWAETIRSFDHVTYYIFPKGVGLFERGWNARPVWEATTVSDDPLFMDDFDRFFSIVTDHEYPYYESLGISYHRN